jgi:hypothetical protein
MSDQSKTSMAAKTDSFSSGLKDGEVSPDSQAGGTRVTDLERIGVIAIELAAAIRNRTTAKAARRAELKRYTEEVADWYPAEGAYGEERDDDVEAAMRKVADANKQINALRGRLRKAVNRAQSGCAAPATIGQPNEQNAVEVDGRDVLIERLYAALEEARRAIGDHFAPNDCYATGPLTGHRVRDLVECPACSFIATFATLPRNK